MYELKSKATTMVITKGTWSVSCLPHVKVRGLGGLTVVRHGLPVWRTDAENNARKDVLEARHKEECSVLRVLDVGLILF